MGWWSMCFPLQMHCVIITVYNVVLPSVYCSSVHTVDIAIISSPRLNMVTCLDQAAGRSRYVCSLVTTPFLPPHSTYIHSYTVVPLNNVIFGTSYSVHYREVPFFGGYKCVSTIGKCCPLFGVSFIRSFL